MKKLLFLLILLYNTAVSQDRNAIRSIVSESMLSNDELRFANNTMEDGFVGEHWFAEVDFNPEESQLVLNFPDGSSATWDNNIAKIHGAGIYSWRGKTNDGLGRATLVYNNGMITGRVSVNPRLTYRSRYQQTGIWCTA